MVMARGLRFVVILFLAVMAAVAACGYEDADVATAGDGGGARSEDAPSDDTAAAPNGPIGGGIASGTGVDAELACPAGAEQDTEEWFGPAGLTQQGAIAEAFGDLVIGWMGKPFEIESTERWSSWGLKDDAGRLVAWRLSSSPTGDGTRATPDTASFLDQPHRRRRSRCT